MTPIAEMGLPITVESRAPATPASRKRQRQRVQAAGHPADHARAAGPVLRLGGRAALFRGPALRDPRRDPRHLTPPSAATCCRSAWRGCSSSRPNLRRVGLSATVDDPDVIRALAGAGRPGMVDLVHGRARRAAGGRCAAVGGPACPGPATPPSTPWPRSMRRSSGARTALVFVNTRFQAEFAFQELWRLNDDNLPIALHHGSLAAEQRRKVEAAMARGELRAVVCTSTLDLGIDWGDVDLVIQLAAPKGVLAHGAADRPRQPPAGRARRAPCSCRPTASRCWSARPPREAMAENALDGEPPRDRRAGRAGPARHGLRLLRALRPAWRSTTRCAAPAPYRDLTWEDFEQVVDFVSTGGYALRTYDRFRRIVKGPGRPAGGCATPRPPCATG